MAFSVGTLWHRKLRDVSTPHVLGDLEAGVASETEVDSRISTHAGFPNVHHPQLHEVAHRAGQPDAVSLDAAQIVTGRFGRARLGWAAERLLKGAGINADPTEIEASGFLGIKVIRKTTDETLVNSATLQNDDHLFFPIGANEVWQITFCIRGSSHTSADWRMRITGPSGARGFFLFLSHYGQISRGLGVSVTFSSSAGGDLIFISGLVANGDVSGNIQLQWAQNIAHASQTIVRANSCIIVRRIA